MPASSVLLDRLHAAGLTDVAAVEPVGGGMAALAGLATRRSGPSVFVKSFVDVPANDLFAAEAGGVGALRERAAIATPEVVLATAGRAGGVRPVGSSGTGSLLALERLCERLPELLPPHPPEAKRFFDVYAQLTGLDNDWGAAQQVRAALKPFRR